MESPSLSQIDLCFRSDDQVSENVIHDAYTFLHFCRACSISIKLDEVVVALSHFLDLVSKFLLAPLVHVGDGTVEALNQSFHFLESSCSNVVFNLCVQNQC